MKISVYITSYNQKEYLRQAIESVLAQTLKPWEIILVDDCSTDGSQDLIKSYQSQYPDLIKGIFHEKNTGVTQARIDAIQSAQGEYITYVDGDDLFLPQKLEEEARLVQEHTCDLAFSNYYIIGDNPHEIQSVWAQHREQMPAFGDMHLEVFARKFPGKSLFRCELVHRDILFQTGLYDPNLKIYEDYELKIRMAARAKIAYTLQALSKYRDNPQGLSKSKQALHLASYEYIYEKHAQAIKEKYPQHQVEIQASFDTFFAHLRSREPVGLLSPRAQWQRFKHLLRKIF